MGLQTPQWGWPHCHRVTQLPLGTPVPHPANKGSGLPPTMVGKFRWPYSLSATRGCCREPPHQLAGLKAAACYWASLTPPAGMGRFIPAWPGRIWAPTGLGWLVGQRPQSFPGHLLGRGDYPLEVFYLARLRFSWSLAWREQTFTGTFLPESVGISGLLTTSASSQGHMRQEESKATTMSLPGAWGPGCRPSPLPFRVFWFCLLFKMSTVFNCS